MAYFSAPYMVNGKTPITRCGNAPLQYAEMGHLLPNGDEVFKRYVDQWLHLARAGGEFDARRAAWLGK